MCDDSWVAPIIVIILDTVRFVPVKTHMDELLNQFALQKPQKY